MLYKLMLFLKLIFREFKAQKLRMALTVLAITWGTLSITLLMAFSVGLENQMLKATAGMGDRVVVIWAGQTTKVFEGLPPGRRLHFRDEDIELINERIPDIEKVSGEYMRWDITVEWGHKQINKMVSGVYPEFGEIRAHYAQAGGRFINQIDYDHKKRVVFLGDGVAKELFGENYSPVGETIYLNGSPFTVIGIMIHKNQNSNYHGSDSDYMVIPATTFVTMYGDPYLDNIVYTVKDGISSKSVERQLFELFGGKYRFDPDDSNALWIWDTGEQADTMRKVFFGIKIFMWFIGGMTLLIAGVGVANIMYVAIREKTREIGTKIALGARKGHIIFQFMIEALTIAFTGGALGIIISLIICKLFWLLPMEGDLELLSRPTINWPVALITVATLSLIGFFAGFFPARKAATINPVEALRYE